jgi:HTH-type transcriptional regulator, sugar sensing transcriptional regulator
MVASTEALDALKSIGLNLYERKIFVSLLAKGVATAAEVSELANVPRSRSYDVLESLAEKGFVIVQPSKPIKYVALKPKEALERTKETLRNKINEMTNRIDKLSGSPLLNELEGIYKKGMNLVEPYELTGTLKGKHIIDRHMQSIFKQARKNINILTTEQGLKDLHSNHYRVLKKISKRGIKLKVAAPFKDSSILKSMSMIGDMKNIKNPASRLCTVDKKHLLMALTSDKDVHDSQDVAFWVSSNHAVENIAEPLFNQVWTGTKR